MLRTFAAIVLTFLSLATTGVAQARPATVKGTVTEAGNGLRLHNASVLIVELGRRTNTDDHGEYSFANVRPGTYTVIVHSPGLGDERQTVTVAPGATVVSDFRLRIAPVREHVTVTASGTEQTTFEAFQSASSLESVDLAQRAHTSLGEVLENEPGVAKRSFGPGSSRPVLRGFDGDRVLVMTDGVPTGSLASQSGDHGENLDVLSVERLEVVRGPATLLYGSNAIGGVVNAITGRHESSEHTHTSVSGYASVAGGTANQHGGGSAGLSVPVGKWLLFGGGSGQRTGSYHSPLGEVPNSQTRSYSGFGGIGWANGDRFFDLSLDYDNRHYGIPFASELEGGHGAELLEEEEPGDITLRMRSHDLKFSAGLRHLEGIVRAVTVSTGFSRYRHGEFEGPTPGTQFSNTQVNYRVSAEHRPWGKLSGSFGISGLHREYESVGAEALAPPTGQNTFAIFGLETLDFERVSFQFGARFEHTGYTPDSVELPGRSFDGASGAAGIRVPLWHGGMFVANYTHSYRAPALEELYNRGPHIGNLAFEIGNPNLRRELGNGLDVTLRHQSGRVRAEATFFRYGMEDFVFLAPTGRVEDGLNEAEFLQAKARYMGGEASISLGFTESVWLNAGLDSVHARLEESVFSELTGAAAASGTPLPRIPPLRARLGLDMRFGSFAVRPQAIFADAQERVFPTETRTAGYALLNLDVSYTIARAHAAHIFSVSGYNLGDRLYRNHLSFIKDLAPEMGRGVRASYTVRFR